MRYAEFSMSEIAEKTGVDKSTVSRELKRNRQGSAYNALWANDMARARRKRPGRKICGGLEARVRACLALNWSPEQIAGRLGEENGKVPVVSHETVYQFVYADRVRGGNLYKHLRTKTKRRKKRTGKNGRRGQIQGRAMIDERPPEAGDKSRAGDWEGDTVVGAGHRGAILTLVETESKYLEMKLLESKEAAPAADAIIECLGRHPQKARTLTTDNGKEFAGHKQVSARLSLGFYFAHPYHSWERGLNENTNGLIRQYFPKKTDFTKLTDAGVQEVMDALNNRPRKSLGYRTPREVFFGLETQPFFSFCQQNFAQPP